MRRQDNVVLVTGGAGFIGSHLCSRLLDEGARIVCVDSFLTGRHENLRELEGDPRFQLIEQDVIEPFTADLGKVDRIYHLACPASPPQYQLDPEHTMLTNVVGTANMLRLAERHHARLLLTSTSEIYGEPEVHPQPEDYRGSVSCTGPRACYDEGKRAAETLAFDFARAGRCETRVARLFNTYGPRMREDDGRIVSNLLSQALSGHDMTVYGEGTQTRSFCFVDDMVEGLIRLMESDVAVPVNLGNPHEVSVNELVERVIATTGTRSRVVKRPLPVDDPTRRRPDISRARQLLGWEPGVPLEEGLEATCAWFRSCAGGGPFALATAAE